MGLIKNATEIRSAADIVAIIGQFVDLKTKGSRLVGSCPFHNEKTPSFTVDPGTNMFKCFGCGEGGDAVHFLMEDQGLTFPEALEYVAKDQRIPVQYENADRGDILHRAKEEKKRRGRLLDIMQRVAGIYRDQGPLPGTQFDEFGKNYQPETFEAFQLSVAPSKSWILKWGKENGIGADLLLAAGLLYEKGARRFDFFRSRILFPIQDQRGRVIAFGGRKFLSDKNDRNPKYLNSPEGLIYKKESTLYGLNHAWRSIREKRFAYLVEGYTDVIALHDHGIKNVVAPCGTAFTAGQAKLIRRYADTVVLLFDGDQAGRKAVEKALPILLEEGIKASVCFLPDDQDPDSFIRQAGHDDFKTHVDKQTTDALIHFVKDGLNLQDPFSKTDKMELAARLVALVKSDLLREEYIRKLCSKSVFGTGSKTSLTSQIKKERDARLEKKKNPLSIEQRTDVDTYGIFVRNNSYFVATDDQGNGREVSNFVIRPIMLITGNEKSYRLVEIINQRKDNFIRDIDSDDFVELNSFKKRIESRGYYLFKGEAKDFLKIKNKIYAEMDQAFPIYTLGLHREGFYTWGNGVSHEGKFHPVDEFGVVQFKGTRYYLPAFSKFRELVKSDDEDNSFESHRDFIIEEKTEGPTFKEWSTKMVDVYGENGMIAVSYYLASLFRDLIFRRFRHFPHLNLFGPQGSGKSWMAISLMYMFGRARTAFDLNQGTNVGFFRLLSQARNALAWYDEYKNDIHPRRIAALKGAYDGSGHVKGVLSQDHRTVVTKVNSGLIISGQDQPTADIALFERCISLNFPERIYTPEEEKAALELKELETSRVLSQITQEILQYRQLVEDQFDRVYQDVKDDIQVGTADYIAAKSRVKSNYAYLLTVTRILAEKLDFGFDVAKLFFVMTDQVIGQSSAMFSEDEVSTFWRIFERLVDTDQLRKGLHYKVESKRKIKIQVAGNSTTDKEFEVATKLLILNFSTVHSLYQEFYKRQLNRTGQGANALRIYLKSKSYYVGTSRGQRFGNTTKRAMVFVLDSDQLGFDIEETDIDPTGGSGGDGFFGWPTHGD